MFDNIEKKRVDQAKLACYPFKVYWKRLGRAINTLYRERVSRNAVNLFLTCCCHPGMLLASNSVLLKFIILRLMNMRIKRKSGTVNRYVIRNCQCIVVMSLLLVTLVIVGNR